MHQADTDTLAAGKQMLVLPPAKTNLIFQRSNAPPPGGAHVYSFFKRERI